MCCPLHIQGNPLFTLNVPRHYKNVPEFKKTISNAMETSGKVYINCKLLGVLLFCFYILGYTFPGVTVVFLLQPSNSAARLKLSNSIPCHRVLIPDPLYKAF